MTCVGQHDFKSTIHEKFIEENKCIRTNDKLEN